MPFSPKLARYVRRLLLGFAILATLIVLFYAIENWRGDRAWQACLTHHIALNDPVDALPSPSSLPTASNFIKTPLLDGLLFAQQSPAVKTFLENTAQPSAPSFQWRTGSRFDLEKFSVKQEEERKRLKLPDFPASPSSAASVLAAQAPIESALAELRQAAAERPQSQVVRPVPISRDEPFNAPIPDFRIVRRLGYSLSVQACALLASRQADPAFADTLAALRLARGFTEMPDALLVESMIGTVMTNIAIQPIWEGCQNHLWRVPQLEQLQNELTQIKPLTALERSMHQERAGFVLTILSVPSQKLLAAMPNNLARWQLRALAWGPRGWLKQNCVAGVTNLQAQFDLYTARCTPGFLTKMATLKTAEYAVGWAGFSPYTIMMQMTLPAYVKVTTTTTSTDTSVALAITACALERHWLAHGSYPESLAELVPTYIDKVPLDIVNGAPLRYRRNDNGRFTLYSIGLDGKDDSGDLNKDWAWPQLAEPK